jgi:hypothetical protein
MLNLDRLRKRIAERRQQAETQAPGKRTHVALIKQQEEKREALSAYVAAQKAKREKAKREYPGFKRYFEVLNREFASTKIIEPGLIDLDLDHIITGLKLDILPHEVRFLALETAHDFIAQVHRRKYKSKDITPYKHLFDEGFVSSLDEARSALRLH